MNIVLLYGGDSYEHDISCISASYMYYHLIHAHYQVIPVAIRKDGVWILPDSEVQRSLAENHEALTIPEISDMQSSVQSGTQLDSHRVWTIPHKGMWHNIASPTPLVMDCVFPIIHGHGGEDGLVQGMLETAEIPFVGCGKDASTIGMNKHITKSILEHFDIPVTPYETILYSNYMNTPQQSIIQCTQKIDFPMLVKPSDGGSSIGTFVADTQETLSSALSACFEFTNTVIVEPLLPHIQEIETAVIQKEQDIRTFNPGRLIIPHDQVYDYTLKYKSHTTKIEVPAQLPDDLREEIRTLSKKVFIALQCEGLARIDFFLTQEQKIYVNEVNTMPGFTPISMFPKLVQQDMSMDELLEFLVQGALTSQQFRKRPHDLSLPHSMP